MRAAAGGSATAVTYSNNVLIQISLLLLWTALTFFWSIFTPPHKTFAARVILFQPLWILRIWNNDTTLLHDLFLFEWLHAAYSYYAGAWQFPSPRDSPWLHHRSYTQQIYLEIFALLGICGLFAGGIVIRGKILAPDESQDPYRGQCIDDQVLPPLLLTSRTTHSRIFPRKNSFSYSYLFVGIPIGVKGRISKVLSVDASHRSWFAVDSADYLDRIHDKKTTLAEKLKIYLDSQGVTDNDYAYAYLVTAPRFLGYSFNPVSFWYLYDGDVQLKYMILEVNNTFDERRMYLLNASNSFVDPDANVSNGNSSKHRIFTNKWEKDLHVSPFSSRKGSYSLRAIDPLAAYEETGQVKIDNTIVLRSSGDHAKVVARVFSEGKPKDPSAITQKELAKFIATWWWVGFATMPRTVYQAFKLFFLRNLHVWYRPEVRASSIGRAYTREERTLEAFFRAQLSHAVTECSQPLRVAYEAAHSGHAEEVWYSPSFGNDKDDRNTLTLKVLSPAFYSRFVQYVDAKQAFERECLCSNGLNRTATLQNADILPTLIDAMKATQGSNSDKPQRGLHPVDTLRWWLVRHLRCPPAPMSYPEKSEIPLIKRSSDASQLDVFVDQNCEDASAYRSVLIKLFLAERLALGIPALLHMADWMIRAALLLSSMLYCDTGRYVDILRPRPLEEGDMIIALMTVILGNAIHIWSLAKG